jgi:hypothetical protein
MGLNRQKEIRIICPQDHTEMRLDDRDINHFPKNISLIKLMIAAQGTRKRIINNSRDEITSFESLDDVEQQSSYSQRHYNNTNKSLQNSSLSLKSKSVISEDTLN